MTRNFVFKVLSKPPRYSEVPIDENDLYNRSYVRNCLQSSCITCLNVICTGRKGLYIGVKGLYTFADKNFPWLATPSSLVIGENETDYQSNANW